MAPIDPDLVSALDRMMRKDLDAWGDFWFWTLVFSTLAVVFGIIAEAPEVLQAVMFGQKTFGRVRTFWYIRIRQTDFKGWEMLCPEIVTRNERHGKLVALAGLIGWVLVAGGVAGEGIAEYFVKWQGCRINNWQGGRYWIKHGAVGQGKACCRRAC